MGAPERVARPPRESVGPRVIPRRSDAVLSSEETRQAGTTNCYSCIHRHAALTCLGATLPSTTPHVTLITSSRSVFAAWVEYSKVLSKRESLEKAAAEGEGEEKEESELLKEAAEQPASTTEVNCVPCDSIRLHLASVRNTLFLMIYRMLIASGRRGVGRGDQKISRDLHSVSLPIKLSKSNSLPDLRCLLGAKAMLCLRPWREHEIYLLVSYFCWVFRA